MSYSYQFSLFSVCVNRLVLHELSLELDLAKMPSEKVTELP